MQKANVSPISNSAKLIEGFERVNLFLLGGTKLHIDSALYSTKSHRNLLSFKDIYQNGYQIETTNEGNIKYLHIIFIIFGKRMHTRKIMYFFH